MLVGIRIEAVTSPPRLVRKPWAPAYRTWFSITSWMPRSTLPCCSRSWASAAFAAGGSGPTPLMARWSDSRTKRRRQVGGELGDARRQPPTDVAHQRLLPESYGWGGQTQILRRGSLPSSRARRTRPDSAGPSRPRTSTTRATTWSGSAPIWSPAPCSRPTAAGIFPMPVGEPGEPDALVQPGAPGGAAAGRAAGLPVVAALGPGLRDPGGHGVRGGDRRLRRPRARQRLDRRRHPGGVPPAAPARLGALGRGLARTGGWPAGCTASRSAACSPASRCSTGSGTPRRWPWSGWSTCCPTSTRPPGCSTPSGRPRTWRRWAWSRSRGDDYLARLRAALRAAAPGGLRG